MATTPPPRVRPGWVTGLCVLYLIATGWSVIAQLQIILGKYPKVTPEQVEYLRSLTWVDHLIAGVLIAVQLVAVGLLWLLRRQALEVFLVAFLLSGANLARHVATRNVLDQFVSLGVIGVAVGIISTALGLLIPAGICAYVWTLRRDGVLH
jgi:hypothetical protein